jgi:hypothetical protein
VEPVVVPDFPAIIHFEVWLLECLTSAYSVEKLEIVKDAKSQSNDNSSEKPIQYSNLS